MIALTRAMKAAIREYFHTKREGNGFFTHPGSKEACVEAIRAAAADMGMSWELVPGLLLLKTGAETRAYRDHNWWIGEPWAKYAKRAGWCVA